MYEKKIPVPVDCALEMTRDVLMGKWKMHLLFYISEGVIRPGELQRKIPGATRRVLNMQLNELEQQGMVAKIIYNQLPPKVEYSLTTIGEGLLPIIDMMGRFGAKNFKHLQQVFISDQRVMVDETKLEVRTV